MPAGTSPRNADLNEEQRRAIHAPIGPTLVPAGPGSGKTTVTTKRVAWMIREMNIDARSIIVFTFTNRAARELRNRLSEELREADMEGLFAGTFHSWGARFLRTHGHLVGLDEAFSIYDQDDTIDTIEDAMRATGDPAAGDRTEPRRRMIHISRWKNRGDEVEQLLGRWRDRIAKGNPPAIARRLLVWREYDLILREQNAADFDDLIALPLQIMKQHPDVLETVQARVRHLLIDEYQDTSRSQHEMVKTLANRSDGTRASIFAVGDTDQAIYAFRQADIRNINEFRQEDYPDARELQLQNNYRSTETIVKAAQIVIENNLKRIDRKSSHTREKGGPIRWMEHVSPEAEAEAIAKEIRDLLDEGAEGNDFCIAYRTNPQARPVEEALARHGVRYTVAGNTEFFRRPEVRVHLDYLRLTLNGKDTGALRRTINVPDRYLGPKAMGIIEGYANDEEIHLRTAIDELAEKPHKRLPKDACDGLRDYTDLLDDIAGIVRSGGTVGEIIDHISEDAGLEKWYRSMKDGDQREATIGELKRIAHDTADTPEQFLERTAMRWEGRGADQQGRVTITTIHQTKGLEFPRVYVVGAEEGLLPLGHSEEYPAELEEERRLMYVAMTRAEEDLTISWCRERPDTTRGAMAGAKTRNERSRFVDEMPHDCWATPLPRLPDR